MRVLIYSESEQAIALRDAEKGAGNLAFLRNPQYFDSRSFDRQVDKVFADDVRIREAYESLGIAVEAVASQSEPAPAPSADKSSKPRKRR